MNTFRRATLALVLCLALPGGYLAHLQSSGNFHAIVEGEAYRSAQPSGADLVEWTRANGIKSVVNLRGSHPGTPWYDDEVATAAALGLAHYDFGMSASKGLTQAEATSLVALLRDVPKPVLIHCKAGSDRTGLASALYLAGSGGSEDAAEQQISLRFGHISIPYTAAWPIDQSWEALKETLGFTSQGKA